MWQPIETAPKDNKIPLFLARFNDDGTIQSFDYNASWGRESESWEMPGVYYYWASENGYVEEPTHWMYQPDWFNTLPGAQAQPAPSVPEDVNRDAARYRLIRRGQHWSVVDGIGDHLRADALDSAVDEILEAAPEAKP